MVTCQRSDGAYLLIWRQSPKEMIKVAACGKVTAKVHFWRSEDLSIELVPESGSHNIDFHAILGRTELVIQLMSTMPIGVQSSAVFLDQSIVLWSEGAMPSQWHFNYYSSLALASTPNLAGAFYQWMVNNGLSAIVKEFFIN
eukprot:5387179-Amphidinium_carterae.1